MKKLLLFGLSACLGPMLLAQTVGLLSYDQTQAFDGYNLMFPHNQGNVYLLNNCGEIVNMWQDDEYTPGNSVYLGDEGLLYACKGKGAASNEWIHAGGGGEKIQILDMDDNLLWEWAFNDSMHRLHHDIAITPEGTILAIAWERKLMEDCVASGRPADALADGELWPEMIIEIEPVFPDGANIIWEWHSWDHLVQDLDAELDNFGSVGDNPQLININYTPDSAADWHHANAIDYNSALDHIVLSVPAFDEIWIIDHSTSTEQAAGHSGGFSGAGGDLIFRWGNPAAYDQGTEEDKKLHFQHDVHWIDENVGSGVTDYGKLMIFNNRYSDIHSAVDVIAPDFDAYESIYPMEGNVWGPEDYHWHYQRPDSTAMHSTGLSSAQRLPNNNTLICVGRFGYTFEITQDEEIVWEYKTPLLAGQPVEQGTELGINQNLTFAMNRYPANWEGFDGADLTPIGYIELNPDTLCGQLPDGINDLAAISLDAYPNPVADKLYVSGGEFSGEKVSISIFDMSGHLVEQKSMTFQMLNRLDVGHLPAGLYVAQFSAASGLNSAVRFTKE